MGVDHKHLRRRGRMIPPSAGTGFAEVKETRPKTKLNVKMRNFILSVMPYIMLLERRVGCLGFGGPLFESLELN